MSSISDKIRPIGEFFFLRRAERAARAYTSPQRVRVTELVEAAERRLRAGREIPQAVPAAQLLRESVRHYLLAIEAASDPNAHMRAFDARTVAAMLPALAPDPLRPDAIPTDEARVRAALGASDPLYFDRLSAEDAAHARNALDRAASMLGGRVEARSVTSVQGTRWGRVSAVALVIVYVAVQALHARFWPKNVALGKHVHASSQGGGDGHELVDGEISATPGLRTGTDDSPSAVIDLGKEYRIDRVAVHNRGDGWFDDCLPLVVELSTDGSRYKEIARRDQHFDADPPWSVDGQHEIARFVRLRVPRRGYLALSEVEVFGREASR